MKQLSNKKPLMLFKLLVFLLPLTSLAQEPNLKNPSLKKPDLIITTWCGPPFSNPDKTGYLDQVLTEAFSRMDLIIDIRREPAERSLYDANNGISDGDFLRIEELGKIYPNLMIVPEYLHNMEFVAFTKFREVTTDNGWNSIAPYTVGIVRGWKILEENIPYTNDMRTDTNSQEILFKMLDKDRIDVGVYAKQFGIEVIDRLGLLGIKHSMPPLAERKMYLFLHKKHKDIIPKLSDILRCMKEDGTFAKIKEKTLISNHSISK